MSSLMWISTLFLCDALLGPEPRRARASQMPDGADPGHDFRAASGRVLLGFDFNGAPQRSAWREGYGKMAKKRGFLAEMNRQVQQEAKRRDGVGAEQRPS